MRAQMMAFLTCPCAHNIQVWDAVIDEKCPQTAPFEVVRCTAHQHVGAQCMSMYNLDNNGELICRSCPVYGTREGAWLCRALLLNCRCDSLSVMACRCS